MCDMMEDEVCEMSNDSLRVKERTTFPCQTGWVTFDEPDKESRVIECPAEEKPSEENGRYLSLLGKFDPSLNFIRSSGRRKRLEAIG